MASASSGKAALKGREKLIQTQLNWSRSSHIGTHHAGGTCTLGFVKPASAVDVKPGGIDESCDIQPASEISDSQGTSTSTISWPASHEEMAMDLSREHHPYRDHHASSSYSYKSSIALALIASETRTVLPKLLELLPSAGAPTGKLYDSMHAQHQRHNPHLPPATVRVLNADTIDVALSMLGHGCQTTNMSSHLNSKPPLCLNMANAHVGGGGWLRGALAQEEAMCYRSSLSFTLKKRFYPIPEQAAIYSPTVVVLRESLASGHKLLNLSAPTELPVISVVSVAALRMPYIALTLAGEERYAQDSDRKCMMEKMKVILRVAGMQRHRRVVLGALGCGAFGNPKEEVARMWREVLTDREWKGWFEEVVFAVLDGGDGNYSVFENELDGLVI